MRLSVFRTTAVAVLSIAILGSAACDSRQQASEPQAPQGPVFSDLMQQAEGHPAIGFDPEVPMGSAKAVTPFAELEVEKAEGDSSYTVGELFAAGADLDGQSVRVRAQVVKFSPAIMNRNFIHLQDGSGNPAERTHNLVATSDETMQVGDIVTIEGVLAADKDFGAGYVYQVILEESRVVQ